MSTLSRFPSNFTPCNKKTPLQDSTNTDALPISPGGEESFFKRSRRAAKLSPKSKRSLTKSKLLIEPIRHPVHRRLEEEADLVSPPLISVKQIHEKVTEANQRHLQRPSFSSSLPNSRSSSPINVDKSNAGPGRSSLTAPSLTFKCALPSTAEYNHDEDGPLAAKASNSKDLAKIQQIFDRLDRIERELDTEAENEDDHDDSSSTPSMLTADRNLTSADVTKYVVPIAPPSTEMREYAFRLMMSPKVPASLARASDSKSTPTPVKIGKDCQALPLAPHIHHSNPCNVNSKAMDSDTVLTSSLPASTSPLGAGVDKILVEGVVRNGEEQRPVFSAEAGIASLVAFVAILISYFYMPSAN